MIWQPSQAERDDHCRAGLHGAGVSGLCVYCGAQGAQEQWQKPDDRVRFWPDCATCGRPAEECMPQITHRSHAYESAAMRAHRERHGWDV